MNHLDGLTVKEHLSKVSNVYRRGVFVITDGDGNDRKKMRNLVNQIEEVGDTKVFGIGIGGVSESSLATSYNHYLKVDNVNALPNALVNLLKSQFRR